MGPFIFPPSKPSQCLSFGSSVLNLTSNEITLKVTSVNDTFLRGSPSGFKQNHFPYLNREAIQDCLSLSFSFFNLATEWLKQVWKLLKQQFNARTRPVHRETADWKNHISRLATALSQILCSLIQLQVTSWSSQMPMLLGNHTIQ